MLDVLNLNEAVKWDAIVSSFADYDVYYLSGYNKGFMIHGDDELLLFSYSYLLIDFYVCKGNEFISIYQIIL